MEMKTPSHRLFPFLTTTHPVTGRIPYPNLRYIQPTHYPPAHTLRYHIESRSIQAIVKHNHFRYISRVLNPAPLWEMNANDIADRKSVV